MAGEGSVDRLARAREPLGAMARTTDLHIGSAWSLSPKAEVVPEDGQSPDLRHLPQDRPPWADSVVPAADEPSLRIGDDQSPVGRARRAGGLGPARCPCGWAIAPGRVRCRDRGDTGRGEGRSTRGSRRRRPHLLPAGWNAQLGWGRVMARSWSGFAAELMGHLTELRVDVRFDPTDAPWVGQLLLERWALTAAGSATPKLPSRARCRCTTALRADQYK